MDLSKLFFDGSQADGRVDNALGRVTTGCSQVRHVGIEILATAGAIVLGIDHNQFAGPTGQGIAQVVEGASHPPIAIDALAATWAGSTTVISALAADLGLGQVLDAGDALGGIGAVFAGSRHGELLEKWFYQELRPLMAICSLNPPGNLAIVSFFQRFILSWCGKPHV
jgi:hypothetical protein